MKDDLSQKKKVHGNMIFSSNVPKRWSFQKNCTGYGLSYIMRKDGISFSRKDDIFLQTENER